MSDLGARIKEAAERVGGLNELAKQIEVPRRTLGNWLKGTNPKPGALKAIARICGVSLDWLVTGDGDPDESPLAVLSRREERRYALERASAEHFEEAFSVGLSKLLSGEVSFPPDPELVAPELMEEIYKVVEAAYRDANQRPPAHKVAYEATVMLNALSRRVSNLNDTAVVSAVLPVLTKELAQRLEAARAAPGTGKREAS